MNKRLAALISQAVWGSKTFSQPLEKIKLTEEDEEISSEKLQDMAKNKVLDYLREKGIGL